MGVMITVKEMIVIVVSTLHCRASCGAVFSVTVRDCTDSYFEAKVIPEQHG
jgi:hypothetical protein